jgi:hypothetical protein
MTRRTSSSEIPRSHIWSSACLTNSTLLNPRISGSTSMTQPPDDVKKSCSPSSLWPLLFFDTFGPHGVVSEEPRSSNKFLRQDQAISSCPGFNRVSRHPPGAVSGGLERVGRVVLKVHFTRHSPMFSAFFAIRRRHPGRQPKPVVLPLHYPVIPGESYAKAARPASSPSHRRPARRRLLTRPVFRDPLRHVPAGDSRALHSGRHVGEGLLSRVWRAMGADRTAASRRQPA